MNVNHEHYMRLALDEARKGMGYTSPNPMVGAVIVKDGRVIAAGYHKKDGDAHAEVNAINAAPKDHLKDSTMYVTLEPCCHYGRTPPCTDAIINAGITRVIIANTDTDDRVAGGGIEILRGKGIDVVTGVLDEEAAKLNSIYFYYKKHQKPYVVLKAALSLDGKIAARTGDSKWISSQNCRDIVHKLRLRLKAIAVGKNTVITDKPSLNCRLEGCTDKPVDKLIFSNEQLDTTCFAPNTGKIYPVDTSITASPETFIAYCNERSIDSILVEGGGGLYSWFLRHKLVDRIYLFYKCSFIGNDGIPVVREFGHDSIAGLDEFTLENVTKIDNNIMLELSNGEPICLLD